MMFIDLDTLEERMQERVLVLKRMRGPVDLNGAIAFRSQTVDLKKFSSLSALESFLAAFPVLALYEWDPARETLRFGTLELEDVKKVFRESLGK